jgi:hypothetical protein
MQPIDDIEKARSTMPVLRGTALPVGPDDGSEFGPFAAQILATEH